MSEPDLVLFSFLDTAAAVGQNIKTDGNRLVDYSFSGLCVTRDEYAIRQLELYSTVNRIQLSGLKIGEWL